MPTVQRFDRMPLRATRTAEGFVQDTAVLTRTGIFEYRQPNGSIRREYRPPEEVFHADSLASYKGKPITIGHPGLVTSKNAKLHTCGACLGEGRADGNDVLGDLMIYDTSAIDAGAKELSNGYTLDLDETPGEINGERYDAVQRNIRVNHIALVPRGRAGNARLNLDAADADTTEEDTTMTMVKVRLDSGISYDAAPEVEQAFKQATADLITARTDADKERARADAAEAKLKDAEKDAEKIRQDAATAAKARLKLEDTATKVGAEFKQDATDTEIRTAVIKKVRGDSFDLEGKSDGYIEAAFDLAVADKGQRQDAVAHQRHEITPPASGKPEVRQDARSARERMIARASGEKTED
jgi:hypothetical protein